MPKRENPSVHCTNTLSSTRADKRPVRIVKVVVSLTFGGYDALLSAVTLAGFIEEMQRVSPVWEKTEKTGKV